MAGVSVWRVSVCGVCHVWREPVCGVCLCGEFQNVACVSMGLVLLCVECVSV